MAACWKLELVVPVRHGERYGEALEPLFPVQRIDVDDGSGQGRMTCYTNVELDTDVIRVALSQVAEALGEKTPDYDIVLLPEIDWLAESQASFAPVRVGQIYVHDIDHRPPGGRRLKARRPAAIEITASVAFGTGGHATTLGCLEALNLLAGRRLAPPGPILDMGCGTGILAIAAAKLFCRPVLASDIDPVAVETARANSLRNGTAGQVSVGQGPGYQGQKVARAGPFGLIVANILAAPLARMASDLERHLVPGGRAVLSGLLAEQERQVLVPHLCRGLALDTRIIHESWATLILHKKRRGGGGPNRIGQRRAPFTKFYAA